MNNLKKQKCLKYSMPDAGNLKINTECDPHSYKKTAVVTLPAGVTLVKALIFIPVDGVKEKKK